MSDKGYTNIQNIEYLKKRIRDIKINREKENKSVELLEMSHIISCLGGKLVKRGEITQKELTSLIYFDWEWIYEG